LTASSRNENRGGRAGAHFGGGHFSNGGRKYSLSCQRR
jgi:hypothetical protein